MRGAPPCAIAVRRFGLWRVLVAAVTTASLAALVAWVLLTPLEPVVLVRGATGLASLALLALAASLFRARAASLRWDGASWTFRDLAFVSAAPLAGELDVAVDLGFFMLLRFTCRVDSRRRSIRWIPVERRGLEREWHSFRCAVYSPRPVADVAGAADPRLP
jgi:hypothetical protein